MKRERSDAAAQVAAKWRKVEYNERDDDLVILGENTVEVIGSESETDVESCEVEAGEIKMETGTHGFQLVRSEVYDENTGNSPSLLDLEAVFGDPELQKCVLFSFQYDLAFLIRKFHVNIDKITVVAQEGTILPVKSSDLTDPRFSTIFHKLVVKEIYMPPYSCHHSKMIINQYRDNTVRIFLPSNNFTWAETNWPQQVCWSSGTLSPSKSPSQNNMFKTNLLRYLKFYRLKEMNELGTMLSELDFSPLDDVEFIFSVPERKEQDLKTGISMLLESLKEYEKKIQSSNTVSNLFLCQTSTIGGPVSRKRDNPTNLFTHILVPFARGFLDEAELKKCSNDQLKQKYHDDNTVPMIIYPSIDEIKNASVGINSAGWFNFNYTKNDIQQKHYEMLRSDLNVFYSYNRKHITKQRLTTPSHSKFYVRTRVPDQNIDDRKNVCLPKQLDWCLFTSANLSTNAWGTLGAKPRNYEVGVLYKNTNMTKPISESDLHLQSLQYLVYNKEPPSGKRTIGVPFPLHLSPYTAKDQSFYQQ